MNLFASSIIPYFFKQFKWHIKILGYQLMELRAFERQPPQDLSNDNNPASALGFLC